MNPELEALLKRINVASKPARQLNGIIRVNNGSVLVKLHGDGEAFTSGDGLDWPRERQAYPHDVGSYSDALIIHALKLDTLARDTRYRTAHEPGRHRVWLFGSTWPGDQVGAAEHPDSEAIAWCQAWLEAFEQEPA